MKPITLLDLYGHRDYLGVKLVGDRDYYRQTQGKQRDGAMTSLTGSEAVNYPSQKNDGQLFFTLSRVSREIGPPR